MKNINKLIYVLCCVLLLASCTKNNDQQDPDPDTNESIDTSVDKGSVTEYISYEADLELVYAGKTSYDNQTYFNYHSDGNRLQRIISTFGHSVNEVIECKDGEMIAYYPALNIDEIATDEDLELTSGIIVLKEPLVIGNSWEIHSGEISVGNLKGTSTITAVDVKIETPVGVYDAIEVSTQFEGLNSEVNYFAKGIGKIKTEYITQSVGGNEYTGSKVEADSVLSEINKNAVYHQEIAIYYPNENADGVEIELMEIQIKSGEGFVHAIEDCLKRTSGEGRPGLITENTKINDINTDNQVIHVDISEDFITENNIGGGYEMLLLDCIALTLMDIYTYDDLLITVNGNNYESEHISFKDQEYLNYNDIVLDLEELMLEAEE